MQSKRSIAVFDHYFTPLNPVGSCHRRAIEALADDYDITVFAVQCDNPRPDRIKFVRVPAPLRPEVLTFVTFYLLAPLIFWIYCRLTKQHFDLVQSVNTSALRGDVCYAHCCYASYLKLHWKAIRTRSIRSWFHWVNETLHARLETFAYSHASMIVVPSQGVARELASEYPKSASKVVVIPNPIDVRHLRRPPDYCRDTFRKSLGLTDQDLVLIFLSLGHYQRKGLPLLLDTFRDTRETSWKLLILGGSPEQILPYQRMAASFGVLERIIYAGHVPDIRPFLWSADAFVLPSYYEAFSLVTFQAAASGLPIITSRLHGVEEFLKDGVNGFLVERDPGSIAQAISRMASQSSDERARMGLRAQAAVERYDSKFFIQNWRSLYGEMVAVPMPEVPFNA